MQNQMFYHIRPNKTIDRLLFVDLLTNISTIINLVNHVYIGFGSFEFDDFKLLHNKLGMRNLISLEKDKNIFKRQKFNLPFNCIQTINESSTIFIDEILDNSEPFIFWLDYNNPADLYNHLTDYGNLIRKSKVNDIIRITLNSNVSSLLNYDRKISEEENYKNRIFKLKEKCGDLFPESLKPIYFNDESYPTILLQILKYTAYKYIPNMMDIVPLSTNVYADGQQMLTFTCIIIKRNDQNMVQSISDKLDNNYSFSWDTVIKISLPVLTMMERFSLNKELPNQNAEKIILQNYGYFFDNDRNLIQNYVRYYKHYPNFRHVNF